MGEPAYTAWLPSALVRQAEGGARSESRRRSTRDWIVDTLCFVFAVGSGLLIAWGIRTTDPATAPGVMLADQMIGGLSCMALWLRRSHPVALAAAMVPVACFSALSAGAVLIAVFSLAIHASLPAVAVVGGLHLLTSFPYYELHPDEDIPFWTGVAITALSTAVCVAWGLLVRARRQLVGSLGERARRAEAEAALREERARSLERERIAREMHDVLAHRISLLSLHAGALEFRPDARPDEIAKAAGVIRDSAHQALQDLREVIGVLRNGTGADAIERPQPTLADLPELLAESRRAGTEVIVEAGLSNLDGVPDSVGRSAYRIVQEGLTNVRKHAPEAAARLSLTGRPGTGLTVELRNPIRSVAGGVQPIPGSGSGLVGLRERASLAGGRMEHGRTPEGEFRLHAWLPWPA